MAEKNNRRENTFRTKATTEAELVEEKVITTEERPKKESPKKGEKAKGKDSKSQQVKEKKEGDGRITKIIGILFLCLAVFLAFAFISYLVSFYL